MEEFEVLKEKLKELYRDRNLEEDDLNSRVENLFDEIYELGYDEGFEYGREEGYEDGYAEGIDDCEQGTLY